MATQWLAVSVPREANVDADRLSHPHLFGEVDADAAAAGWVPRRARVPAHCWRALRDAMRDGGEEVAERDRAR
eukprot:1077149-Pleurochrysis_carterae.AAC.1